jgi:HD-like signal output (HDOD) protein/ActR/RegA family two-component response regulator
MTKPMILFIDDEQHIMDGIQLLLRPLRSQWDMSFATSGAEALKLMETESFDVVMSDMRMPGMDGAQLLAEVAQHSPETVRMILSGYSDQANVMRTVKLAHQYLSKPCPAEELKGAISKALRLRGIICSGALKQLISRIESLPPLPQLYEQLVEELRDGKSSLQRIGDIISQDVAMTSSILRMVNSAFFGPPTHVSSPLHAVKLLGVETIRVLVLSIGLFSYAGKFSFTDFSLERLWAHSKRVSCFCRTIAEAEGQNAVVRDECFIAGMLHDLGKLVLATTMPEEYRKVLTRVQGGGVHLHVAEREAFGVSHAEVCAYLLSLWGFKDSITEAVCWHHEPQHITNAGFSPLLVVAVADHFDHDLVRINSDREWLADEIPSIPMENHVARLLEWRNLCENVLVEDH